MPTAAPAAARHLRSIDPATDRQLATYPAMSDADADLAVGTAVEAQRAWRRLAVEQRAARVRTLASALRREADPLARLITAEMGKPRREADAEVEKCAATTEWLAEHAAELLAPLPLDGGEATAEARLQPLGVVLAIMPWNFPAWQVVRAAVPALLAGNAVLLKHAPNVTGCALALRDLFAGCGLPLELLVLADDAAASRVVADPRIAAVTLTGSVRAGAAVGALAGRHLKKVVLELGGSDPFVVLPGADVATAAAVACRARFQNAGQSCVAAKRFVVAEAVAEPFVAALADHVRALRVGDPADPRTDVGPLARADLADALQDQLDRTLAAGAHAVVPGGRRDGPGCFFAPALLTGVRRGMAACDEETFGPLAAVQVVAGEDEAIAAANDSDYGLGASVWTGDPARGRALADELDAGMVFVNGMVASDARLPFGGVKRSGVGRELSAFGLREFVNVQTVWSAPAPA